MMKSKLKAKHISGQRAPALDMASVSTKAPPENPVSNPPTRIFGLQDAPCYYPTEKEFMEPLRFIESIRPEAEKAGICKIIPPEGWKPTFALDTELFRFKTRIQKLNSMEGETRTNINYLDQLYKFHRQQGHPVLKIPQLDKRPIDLFRLKKEVAARGGYQKVTAGKKWAEIGRGLDYTRKQCTSLSNALKSAYVKVILPYEVYLSKQARPPSDTQVDTKAEPSDDSVTPGKQPSPAASTSTSTSSSTSKVVVGIRKSKRIKKDPVSYADSEPSSPSYSERMSSEPCEKKEASVDPDLDVCEICQTENDLEMMLICDGCELGYHTYCLTPPLTQIPRTDWYCAKCLVAGDDFGFEEGEEYSLSSFQQKCNSFKTQWFEKHGFKDGKVPEDAVEREFWKLVEDAYETVQVEYGADLHSTQHGSGFPSLERHPNDKYSTHPSNLNNMPVLPESLFCHIKSDISGMMIPWLYVGMCFSTFCWHNEDHYTYSINYMHWGDTKTWYGIPASDALKFEDTMKQAVPELFEQQPDLLFQLVTMLSPERLVSNGVKVLALDQRPGQFVVTFPQAYHAGFNHGFNFAEAVNFAPPDWCQLGLECVKRYKEHKKQPVFSHDELIITTALDDTSIATAQWLQGELDNLLERELSCRQSVQKQYPEITVVTEETDRPEEEVQCHHCNAYIYLSQVVCKCSSRVVCDDHVDELCSCEIKDKTLRLRYSDDYLKDLAKRVSETAAIPGAWTDKFRKIMMETRVPSLKMLRSLLSEADKIPFMFREAAHLREFVAKANDWVEAATKLMIRKHHQGRRVLERTQGSAGKRLEDLQGMLDQAERLRFDCPEIKQLQESIETMQEFQMEARRALDRPVHNLQECRELQEAGLSMNISMEEIDQLDTIVTDLNWIERATTKGVHVNDYHLICSLVTDAERTGVSPSNTLLMDLIRKQREGQDWEASALAVLNKNSVDLDRLQAVIESGKDIAVPRTVMSKAETLYNKVIEWEKTAAHLLKKANDPLYSERPNISELKRAVRLADSIPTQLEHKEYFEGQAKKFDDWFSRTYQLFNPGDVKRVGPALDETLEDLQANVEACTVDENFDKSAPSMSRPVAEKSVFRPNAANGEASGRVPIEGPTLTTETKEADQSNESSYAPEGSEPQTSLPTDSTAAMDVDEDQIYCLCRTAESGMMVECDECHEWYHGTCVRVTKREASSKSNYICPVCNLSITIRRDNHRPTLGQLAAAYTEGHSLHFSTVNVPALGGIVAQATQFMEKVDRFLQRESITLADIKQVKGFLRKVEGLDIDLVRERDVLRNHILRLIPSSMPAGGVQFSNFPSAPPLSTINSQCICLGTHSSPSVQQNGFALESGSRLMIQCGGCQDWYHLDCVGMNSDQAHRLTRFSCPICAIVRKKGYPLGTPLYPEEVSSRASERIHAAREQAELKKRRRKSSKDSIDLGNGTPAGTEEKKRRVYKKRDPSDGENKPRRRKSSGGQSSVSTDSNTSTPTQPQTPFVSASGASVGSRAEPAAGPVAGSGTITMGTGLGHGPTSSPASGSTASTATIPSATTLPSFNEGFLLPPESVPLSQTRPRVHHPPHPHSQPRPVFHPPPSRPVPQDVHVHPSRASHAPLRGSSHPHSAQQHQGHPGPHPVQHTGQHGHSSHSVGQTSSHPSHSGHPGQHSSHPGHSGHPSQHPNQHSGHPYTPPAPVHRSRQQQTPPHPGHAPIHHPVPHPSHHPAHPAHSSHSHSRSHVPPNHSHTHSPPYQHSPPQRYHPGTPPYQSPPPLRDAVKLAPIQGHPPRERPSSGPPSHYDRPPYAGPSPGQYTPPQMSSSASPSSTSTSPQMTHHRRDHTSHSQPPMPHHHPHPHSHSTGSPTSRPYFGYSNGQGPHPQAPHPSMPASVRSRSPTIPPVARGHPSYPPHPSHPPHPPHRSHSPHLHPSHTSARSSYPSLAHGPHSSHSSHSSHPSHSYPSHPPHPSQHHRGSMHPRGPRGDVVEIESDEEMR